MGLAGFGERDKGQHRLGLYAIFHLVDFVSAIALFKACNKTFRLVLHDFV